MLVALRAGRHEPVPVGDLYRFRTDTFVEAADHARRTIAALPRRAAGAEAVGRKRCARPRSPAGTTSSHHLSPSGRYIYEHDLVTGRRPIRRARRNYSMPRHAGTTYFLAELYRITKEEWLREPIERAFAHLADLLAAGHCAGTLPDGTRVRLRARSQRERSRSSARRRSRSSRSPSISARPATRATCRSRRSSPRSSSTCSAPTARSATSTIRGRSSPTRRPSCSTTRARPRSRSRACTRSRAMRGTRRPPSARSTGSSTGTTSSSAASSTARSTGRASPRRRSGRPCKNAEVPGVLRRLRRVPARAAARARRASPTRTTSSAPTTSRRSSPPYNTPAGSRTEAMISAYLLGVHHGDPDPAVRAQIAAALQYALGQQIRPDSDFDVVGAGRRWDAGQPDRPQRPDRLRPARLLGDDPGVRMDRPAGPVTC